MEYNDQNVIKLFAQELSYKQIGDKLGVSRGAISGRVSRLRKKFPNQFLNRAAPSVQKEAKPSKVVQTVAKKFTPNRYTIRTQPYRYQKPTKADLYAELKKAVENTR